MHKRYWALFGAAALGLLTLATPASATDLPAAEAQVEDCETASLTFHNPRNYPITFRYQKDGAGWIGVPVAAKAEEAVPLGYAARSGDHTVSWEVWKSPESDDRTVTGEANVDCLTDVTPAVPTVVDATCDGPGAIVIKRTEGVRYKMDGKHIGKGSNPVPPGTYDLTAVPREGYELADSAESSWTLTVYPGTGCDPEPSTDPSETPGDPSESPSGEPSSSPSEIAVTGPPAAEDMPTTGTSLTWLLVGAFGLIGAGAGTLLVLRRRRQV